MSPVWPKMIAASSGPIPVDVGDGGARSQDGFDDALVDGDELVVEAANVAQRHDRRCSGVVRVCLVGAAGVEQPHPGREGRGHIQHGLAGGDELLGQ